MTSGPQVARLLTLMPYLRRWDGIDIATAAAEFGVTPGQLLRDLQVLVMCGLPGGGPNDLIDINLDVAEDEGYIHVTNTPEMRPLRFTRDEAMSLIVAVDAVREVADPVTAEAAGRVIAKLSALVGGEAPPVSLDVAAGGDEVRATLASAVREHSRLRLTYDGVARRETTAPVVDPAAVEVRDGVAYLVAWSLERDDWRTYRLDRIAAVDTTGEAAEDHGPVPSPKGWFDGKKVAEVEVVVDAGAAWVGEYYPNRGVESLRDGWVKLRLPVSDPGWLAGLLLRLGPHVHGVDPPSAADAALEAARAALHEKELE